MSCILIVFQSGIIKFNEKLNMTVKVERYYENTEENSTISNFVENEVVNNTKSENLNIWKIEIPKIELVAEISEGTTAEILNEFVGHFEETPKMDGNIGLAAHNRGYNVNYFENIKLLEVGDEIFYTYNGITKKYIVTSKEIIDESDWKKLENTEDNRLTLITCVENQPQKRRCIQAVEEV